MSLLDPIDPSSVSYYTFDSNKGVDTPNLKKYIKYCHLLNSTCNVNTFLSSKYYCNPLSVQHHCHGWQMKENEGHKESNLFAILFFLCNFSLQNLFYSANSNWGIHGIQVIKQIKHISKSRYINDRYRVIFTHSLLYMSPASKGMVPTVSHVGTPLLLLKKISFCKIKLLLRRKIKLLLQRSQKIWAFKNRFFLILYEIHRVIKTLTFREITVMKFRTK